MIRWGKIVVFEWLLFPLTNLFFLFIHSFIRAVIFSKGIMSNHHPVTRWLRMRFENPATVTGVSHRVNSQAVRHRQVVVMRVAVSAIRTIQAVTLKKDPCEEDSHAKCAGTMTLDASSSHANTLPLAHSVVQHWLPVQSVGRRSLLLRKYSFSWIPRYCLDFL